MMSVFGGCYVEKLSNDLQVWLDLNVENIKLGRNFFFLQISCALVFRVRNYLTLRMLRLSYRWLQQKFLSLFRRLL